MQAVILYRLAVHIGYLSERHVQLLVLCGIFTGVAAVATIGDGLAGFLWAWVRSDVDGLRSPRTNSWISFVLLAALASFGLPEVFKPLHANREGHRQAGLWLAENTHAADPVIDPYCWAHFYAGRVFWEGKTPPTLPDYQPTRYVVLETAENEHSRLPAIKQARDLARQGRVVYHWPPESVDREAKILVFAVGP
jgi:hypothetical protein